MPKKNLISKLTSVFNQDEIPSQNEDLSNIKSYENEIKELKKELELKNIDLLAYNGLIEALNKYNMNHTPDTLYSDDFNMGSTSYEHFHDYKDTLTKQLSNHSKKLNSPIECNICGYKSDFEFLKKESRDNAMCPSCGSLEIDRAVLFYLTNKTDILDKKYKVMIYEPPEALYNYLNSFKNIDLYVISKTELYGTEHIMRLTDIKFDDNTFDYAIIIQAFQSINSDERAISEIYRTLKIRGKLITTLPVDSELKTTFQLDYVNTPDQPRLREKFYKSKYNYRIYGCDAYKRFVNAGFKLMDEDYLFSLSEDIKSKHGILEDYMYVCKKEGDVTVDTF